MTNAEYRSHPAISRSELFKIGKSPLHFKYERDNPPEPSAALIFGQAFHKFVLEPDGFDEEFAVAPNVDRRTRDGREQWAAFQAEADGKQIITLDDMTAIQGMRDALMENDYAAVLIKRGKHETPFFWVDEMTGEECKCRPDIMLELPKANIIADLKSCAVAAPWKFDSEIVEYGYDLQAYMYTEGVKANIGKDWEFVFIAIEKKPPYAINVTKADENIFMSGLDRFREYIGTYHNCKESGKWYSYNGFSGAVNISHLPAWRMKDFQ